MPLSSLNESLGAVCDFVSYFKFDFSIISNIYRILT